MLFRKKHSNAATYPFPGVPVEIDEAAATVAVERYASEAAGVYPVLFDNVESSQALAGLVTGYAASGLRAAAFTQGPALTEMHASLTAAVAKRLPFIVQYTCTPEEHHDAYFALAGAGLFQLFAANVQEAADFTLIAHRIAELGLNPGLCAHDDPLTGALSMPEPALVEAYLGNPDDPIACPTPAQAILFGERRRRIPALLDLDRPLGLGAALDPETAFRALAARQPFFFDHLAGLADQAMAEFGALTGRFYARASGYRLDDAAYVVAAQGAVVEHLRAVVDHLRTREKIKVGVLNMTLFRPFPGDLVSKLLEGKQAVTVLEGAHHPLAEDQPLLRDMRCALDKALENGAAAGEELPYPAYAVYEKVAVKPRFFSARYSATTPSFDDLCAVVQNMLPDGARKRSYYLGLRFDRPGIRLPKLERLQQVIRKGYPDLDQHTLATEGVLEPVAPSSPEPEAPWTVRDVPQPDGTVYDLGRFWDSVGYLHATGQQAKALADPFVATGMVPARSSAFRDLSPLRTEIPHLIAERCTGCGSCWSYCPDSALPVTLQDLASLVDTAIERCEAGGPGLIQIRRVSKHLVQQAHRLVARDDLRQYLTLGDLLEAAFAQLIERMKPKEDQKEALEDEFRRLHDAVASFPIVRTETFFDHQEKAEKGSGLLFAMAVNPTACKACALCVAACPEEALEMVEQTDALLGSTRQNWDFLMKLPEVPAARIEPFIVEDRPETQVYRLLNRRAYHAMLGGDDAAPGNGIKTALHLFIGTIEAVMQPRVQALLQTIDALIERIEDKIQTTITGALTINDFEAFGETLSQIEGQGLSLDALTHAMADGKKPKGLDKASLQRLTEAREALRDLRDQHRHAAHGDGRARLALAMGAGEATLWSRTYPYNPFAFPWIHHRSSDAAAMAEGLFEGIMRAVADGFKTVRKARLALDDTYDPAQHGVFFEQFTWKDFSEEEWAVCPPLVVFADEGSQVTRLLRSPLPIRVLLVNGHGFAFEEKPGGSTQRLVRDDPGWWALAQRHVFVVQSSISHPGHLIEGVIEGLAYRGPALFHVAAPDPTNHGIMPEQVAEQAERAVRSRAFPLFKYHPPGSLEDHLDLAGNPDIEQDWATQRVTVEEANGLPSEQDIPLTVADWAAREGRFQDHFRAVPTKDWHPDMAPLSDFIAQPAEEREGLTPFIQLVGPNRKIARVVVSPAMVALTEERHAAWQRLLESAGLRSPYAERYAQQTEAEIQEERERLNVELTATYEARAARQEQTHAQRYHAQLTAQLLTLSGYGPDSENAHTVLREYAKHDLESET